MREILKWFDSRNKWKREAEELRATLEKYGRHLMHCPRSLYRRITGDGPRKCTCGFEKWGG